METLSLILTNTNFKCHTCGKSDNLVVLMMLKNYPFRWVYRCQKDYTLLMNLGWHNQYHLIAVN